MTDDLYVTVSGLPSGPPVDPDATYCDLCLRPFAHPHRKLRPIPNHPGYHWCRTCRSLDNDAALITWWLARDIAVRRFAIKARHGIDPVSWHQSRPRAEQINFTTDVNDVPSAVESTPVGLGMPCPRSFWDVRHQRPNSVRDAHPDVE